MALKLCPRFGLTPPRPNWSWLVRTHLLMSATAQARPGRRKTITDFVGGAIDRAAQLTLLTIVDIARWAVERGAPASANCAAERRGWAMPSTAGERVPPSGVAEQLGSRLVERWARSWRCLLDRQRNIIALNLAHLDGRGARCGDRIRRARQRWSPCWRPTTPRLFYRIAGGIIAGIHRAQR
jgi:hypothetical protein